MTRQEQEPLFFFAVPVFVAIFCLIVVPDIVSGGGENSFQVPRAKVSNLARGLFTDFTGTAFGIIENHE